MPNVKLKIPNVEQYPNKNIIPMASETKSDTIYNKIKMIL